MLLLAVLGCRAKVNVPRPSTVTEQEGEGMAEGTRRMGITFLANGHPTDQLKVVVDPKGTHSEGFWRKYFAQAVSWLFEEE